MALHSRRILYQDDHFLAISKLPGELTVKGKGVVGKLPLLDFLRKDYPGIHPLNRLDFDASGIVLFAKSRAVLKRMLEEKTAMEKTYRTIVAGNIAGERGVIRFPLPVRSGRGEVASETRYRVLEQFGVCTFVEVEIKTGRRHQIRRHVQKIGHPLVNDPLYGDRKATRRFVEETGYRKMFLHAAALRFRDPISGKEIRIEDPLPRAFGEVLKLLRQS